MSTIQRTARKTQQNIHKPPPQPLEGVWRFLFLFFSNPQLLFQPFRVYMDILAYRFTLLRISSLLLLFPFQLNSWKRSSPGCWIASTSVVFHLLQRWSWAQPATLVRFHNYISIATFQPWKTLHVLQDRCFRFLFCTFLPAGWPG